MRERFYLSNASGPSADEQREFKYFCELVFKLAGEAHDRPLAEMLQEFPQWHGLNMVRPLLWPEKLRSHILNNRLANRSGQRISQRPLAVVIYAKDDWNSAFDHPGILEELMEHYDIMYYEVASTDEFIEAFKEATEHQLASFVLVGGHGNPQGIHFDDPMGGQRREMSTIKEDREALRKAELYKRVQPDAVGVLSSCEVGKSFRGQMNITDVLSLAFHIGFYSSKEKAYLDGFKYKDGNIIGTTYRLESGKYAKQYHVSWTQLQSKLQQVHSKDLSPAMTAMKTDQDQATGR